MVLLLMQCSGTMPIFMIYEYQRDIISLVMLDLVRWMLYLCHIVVLGTTSKNGGKQTCGMLLFQFSR